MGLRCSLLGCDFGEPTIENEREERGSEVVLTVTEYEECTRCGARNVISENTGVTSLAAEPAVAGEDEDEAGTDADAGAGVDADTAAGDEHPSSEPADGTTTTVSADDSVDETAAALAATESTEDPESIAPGHPVDIEPASAPPVDSGSDTETDGESESKSESEPEPEPEPESDIPTDEHGNPITDDAEILEDTEPDGDSGRAHGEWPDVSDVGQSPDEASDPAGWPAERGDINGGIDANANDDDATAHEADDDNVSFNHDPDDMPEEAVELSYHDSGEPEDDAIIVDADTGAGSDPDPPTESTTTAPSGASETAPSRSDPSTPSQTGIESAQSAPVPGESSTDPRKPTQFHCPACSFTAPGTRSSLRPGDICPECKRGYLGERELESGR